MTASFQDRDPDVRPADDLFRHVNGSWLSTTTIPNDQASTGSFRVLRDNSEAAVHDILEELTSGDAHELRQAASASTDHEVNLMAELYRRFMDSAAVEAVGTIPLTPILARIDRVTTISEFMTLLGQHYRESLGALFYLAEESDPADPTRYVPWMGQAGLGLPDEA
ncbi:MAG: peptidase M13, partial [Cutibacterium acnes]|nr:peptidase M13 [Cutibacterium acnes]